MFRLPAALLPALLLASCATRVPPRTAPVPPPPAAALPAAAPQQDWRDVPLTPGTWRWHDQGGRSLAQFGVAGAGAQFALRCDTAGRRVVLSRAGAAPAGTAMTVTTSFGAFAWPAANGAGDPPAVVASAAARDPRLDWIAFSRGRFLVDVPGQPRLVLPAWPEVARVIEDCRG